MLPSYGREAFGGRPRRLGEECVSGLSSVCGNG